MSKLLGEYEQAMSLVLAASVPRERRELVLGAIEEGARAMEAQQRAGGARLLRHVASHLRAAVKR